MSRGLKTRLGEEWKDTTFSPPHSSCHVLFTKLLRLDSRLGALLLCCLWRAFVITCSRVCVCVCPSRGP